MVKECSEESRIDFAMYKGAFINDVTQVWDPVYEGPPTKTGILVWQRKEGD